MTHRIIKRILRVNHAGEHGAVLIYSKQLARAREAYPDLVPWLEETLSHEEKHRGLFLNAMPERDAKPCRMVFVWTIGGAALGSITALFGRAGIFVCTAAVERTVHRHLVEQIAFLKETDPPLAQLVSDILIEEDMHLSYAESKYRGSGTFFGVLSAVVGSATELLIFLSTRGDSLRLKSRLPSY